MLAKGCNCMASLIYLVVQSSRVTGLLSVGLFMDMVYSSSGQGIGLGKVCWKPTMSKGLRYEDIIFLYPLLSYLSHGKWCGNPSFPQG